MSGYLDVKYPFKSNIGLNPFRTWKKQWCILRPSPTKDGGGCLAVYSSEAGAVAGTVEILPGSSVSLTKSRSKPHAFVISGPEGSDKARVLLSGQSLHESQQWMDKIRVLLAGNKYLGTNILLKDTFSTSILSTDLSNTCGLLQSDGTVSLSPRGLTIAQDLKGHVFVPWRNVTDVMTDLEDGERCCVIDIDSGFQKGAGVFKFKSPIANEMMSCIKQALKDYASIKSSRRLSRSAGDLRTTKSDKNDNTHCQDWNNRPSEISQDDTHLLDNKVSRRPSTSSLSRCTAEGDLTPAARQPCFKTAKLISLDDSMHDRRSIASIASGIYEEIPDIPSHTHKTPKNVTASSNATSDKEQDCVDGIHQRELKNNLSGLNDNMTGVKGHSDRVSEHSDKVSEHSDEAIFHSDALGGHSDIVGGHSDIVVGHSDKVSGHSDKVIGHSDGGSGHSKGAVNMPGPSKEELLRGFMCGSKLEEPMYESVAECVYGTMRRSGKRYPPPPLPPRIPLSTKHSDAWNPRADKPDDPIRHHNSLGSLPRCYSVTSATKSENYKTRTLPKFEKSKQAFNAFRKRLKSDSRLSTSPKSDTKENKKKRFDFPPAKELFKNFRVTRKKKTTNLTKIGETKSCEYLDETELVSANRSKSAECLDSDDDIDLSIDCNEDVSESLTLPRDIVELFLKNRGQIKNIEAQRNQVEDEYMPMSPIVPPQPEQHYIVMSPKAN